MNVLERWAHAWRDIPDGSLARRALYAALLGVGIAMSAGGSFLFNNIIPPIGWRGIPDVRLPLLFLTGLNVGLVASFGGASRRKYALWTAIGFTILFHLEEATIHWIGPYPGSITGTRVGILGTAGSLLALASVLLLHLEVEGGRLRADLLRRGASFQGAESVRAGLQRVGARRVMGIAAGVAGLAVLVRFAEAIFGDTARGGAWILLVGAALLLGLALALLRIARPKNSPPEEPEPAPGHQ